MTELGIAGSVRTASLKLTAAKGHRVMASGGHRLIWLSGRNTPKVVAAGKKYTPKPSEGKVVKSRKANAEEEATIRKGKWVRVDKNGKKAGQKGYGTGSKVRPQFKYGKKK